MPRTYICWPTYLFRTMLGLPLAGSLAISLSSLVDAAAVPTRQTIFLNRDDSESWQSFIRAPSSRHITPQSIVKNSVVGNVTNPSGIITSEDPTILSRQALDSDPPCLTVDFGKTPSVCWVSTSAALVRHLAAMVGSDRALRLPSPRPCSS